MLDTFIKNRGTTKTILHDNNHNAISQINWDADYDGDIANVSLDFNTNGETGHYDIQLDNEDLAEILSIPTVNSPIDKRLTNDFKKKQYTMNRPYIVEIEDIKNEPLSIAPEIIKPSNPFYTHVSSPLPNEELLIPLTIKQLKKSNSLTKRHRRHNKHHNTYKVYRHIKSSKPKSHRRSKRYSRKTF